MNNKHLLAVLCGILVVPMSANAAGTYYTGGTYQSPQYQYSAGGTAPSAYNPRATTNNAGAYSSTRYQPGANRSVNNYPAYNNTAQRPTAARASSDNAGAGFYASAGISHEFAQWEFSMKNAGSKLDYNNIGWNVFDVNLGYNFGKNVMGLSIDAGLKYGMQSGESQMVDDDITNGGYYIATYCDDVNGDGICDDGDTIYGDLFGNALSVGTSKGGSMFGYNVGLSLTDAFQIGNVRIAPSVGYRSLSYKLTTEDNYGLSVDTGYCIQVPGMDEIQCDPLIIIVNGGDSTILWDNKNTSGGYVDTGGTYYYGQPGKSHEYDVEWAGPYLALDMDYTINQNNAVNARVELGLPAYSATGNQPYRIDWLHPTSVEDTGSIGDAYHLGLLANWTTALSDYVALQIGFTYDYYKLSGAQAKTNLSSDYYLNLYWDVVDNDFGGDEEAAQAAKDPTVMGVLDLIEQCPNWVCKAENEVDSFYKSLGIRIGFAAKF